MIGKWLLVASPCKNYQFLHKFYEPSTFLPFESKEITNGTLKTTNGWHTTNLLFKLSDLFENLVFININSELLFAK
jgi:hypothetical protein